MRGLIEIRYSTVTVTKDKKICSSVNNNPII